MKKFKFYLAILISSMSIISCSKPDDTKVAPISDEYNLLTVNQAGEVIEIGNNTGKTTKLGQIENKNKLIYAPSLTDSPEYIYAEEFVNSGAANQILIYNKQSNSTHTATLQIPSTINVKEAGIMAMSFNGNELIAVVCDNLIASNTARYLISINVNDFTVTDLGITFNGMGYISAIKQINNKIYLTTNGDGFLEIDLVSKTSKVLINQNLISSGLTLIDNNRFALMVVDKDTGKSTPAELNLSDQSVIKKSNNEYSIPNSRGSFTYYDGTYFNLTSIDVTNGVYGILKCNFETNKTEIVEIKSATPFNSVMNIIGTTKI